jgi:hypothetical protein
VAVGEIETIRSGFSSIVTGPLTVSMVTGNSAVVVVVVVVVVDGATVVVVDEVDGGIVVVAASGTPAAQEAAKRATTAKRGVKRLNTGFVSFHWRRRTLWNLNPSSEGQATHCSRGDLATSPRRITVAGQRRDLTGLRSRTAPGTSRYAKPSIASEVSSPEG